MLVGGLQLLGHRANDVGGLGSAGKDARLVQVDLIIKEVFVQLRINERMEIVDHHAQLGKRRHDGGVVIQDTEKKF